MDGKPSRGAVSDRAILGPADVRDDVLASMVEDDLGLGSVELVSCHAEVAEYDLDALTTAGRYRVHGTARHAGGTSPYSFFVKVVQSWTRSPQFEHVPESFREIAAASLPWRSEPSVYRSDLQERLPDGLSMPRAYSVVDIDDSSAGLWLQLIDHDRRRWESTPSSAPPTCSAGWLRALLSGLSALSGALTWSGTTIVVGSNIRCSRYCTARTSGPTPWWRRRSIRR